MTTTTTTIIVVIIDICNTQWQKYAATVPSNDYHRQMFLLMLTCLEMLLLLLLLGLGLHKTYFSNSF